MDLFACIPGSKWMSISVRGNAAAHIKRASLFGSIYLYRIHSKNRKGAVRARLLTHECCPGYSACLHFRDGQAPAVTVHLFATWCQLYNLGTRYRSYAFNKLLWHLFMYFFKQFCSFSSSPANNKRSVQKGQASSGLCLWVYTYKCVLSVYGARFQQSFQKFSSASGWPIKHVKWWGR